MTIAAHEWQAIVDNDQQSDNLFWYAVKSTKIFCRPSCPSRLPKKENIEIFYTREEPLQAGYRPCKRCQPLGKPVSHQEWVAEIDTILAHNYSQKLTLEELAYLAHGSASHLRHVYKAVTGTTPQKKLLALRLMAAKQELLETNLPVKEIAKKIGMTNEAYFIKKFRECYGTTPLQFRLQKR